MIAGSHILDFAWRLDLYRNQSQVQNNCRTPETDDSGDTWSKENHLGNKTNRSVVNVAKEESGRGLSPGVFSWHLWRTAWFQNPQNTCAFDL